MSHVTTRNESRYTYEWVTLHLGMSRCHAWISHIIPSFLVAIICCFSNHYHCIMAIILIIFPSWMRHVTRSFLVEAILYWFTIIVMLLLLFIDVQMCMSHVKHSFLGANMYWFFIVIIIITFYLCIHMIESHYARRLLVASIFWFIMIIMICSWLLFIYTYKWVTSHAVSWSHTWMSHVPHVIESCPTYRWSMVHIWVSHITSHAVFSSRIWMGGVPHINESCPSYEWVISYIWMKDDTAVS